MAGIIVIFDFDRTLIDGDSDNWVVTQMNLTSLFNQLYRTIPWNSLMDRMMEELYVQGKTAQDIAQCLSRIPIHQRVIEAIKSVHAFGCDLRIISDANQFFIEKILEHHGLSGCFSRIDTNPAFVDDVGKIRIFPYHDSKLPPHGCTLCPSNMCKGSIIEKIQVSGSQNGKNLIYLGDGGGDFCPTLKLGESDYVMPRKEYPLWERIRGSSKLVKAEVHEWSGGEELAKILLHIVRKTSAKDNIVNGDSDMLNASDFKASSHSLCFRNL